jgi:protein-S-isoprenylcysteine O-methyltransferase Ste14
MEHGMQFHEQMTHQGEWLFRWRSYLPLLLLIPWLMLIAGDSGSVGILPIACDSAAWIAAVLGLLIRILVVGYAAPGTSGRNARRQRARSLNTTGLYALVRHPLYLGNLLITLAWSLSTHSGAMLLIAVLAFALYYERIIVTEEAFLTQQFGNKFREWSQVTPTIVPRWATWSMPDKPICWRTVIRREYLTACLIVAVMVAVHLVHSNWGTAGAIVDPFWRSVAIIDLAVFLAVRWIANHTSLLQTGVGTHHRVTGRLVS